MGGKVDLSLCETTSDVAVAERAVPTAAPAVAVAERPLRLSDASVLTLDGYGTLVDREAGIVTALMPWLHSVGVSAGRHEILRAFGQAERAHLTPGTSYHDVLISVHGKLAEFFGVDADQKAAQEFAASIGRWPVHPDASAALAYLKQHFRLIVLTNADRAAFDATSQALGVSFDAVYTAEDTGTYKPNTEMFEFLLNRLREDGVERRRVLHVAGSIRFDHVPAKRLGMNTCWIHRRHGTIRSVEAQKQSLHINPDFKFRTLGGLADAHWAEVRES